MRCHDFQPSWPLRARQEKPLRRPLASLVALRSRIVGCGRSDAGWHHANPQRYDRRPNRRGSLLVESMAAIALLAITMAVAATSVTGIYRARQQMLHSAVAHQVLANAIERLEQAATPLPAGSHPLPLDAWAKDRLRNGSVSCDVGPTEPSGLRRVTVAVQWQGVRKEELRDQVVYWVSGSSTPISSEQP